MTLTEAKKEIDVSEDETPTKSKLPSTDSTGDGEGGEVEVAKPEVEKTPTQIFIESILGTDYHVQEVYFVLLAACIIALNQGYLNGVCMSGLSEHENATMTNVTKNNKLNPNEQMIAGFAGAYTNTALALLEQEWNKYTYNLCLLLSYMGGAFIAAMINPHAKPYVIEPKYGPTFILGGAMLLGASIILQKGGPSRFVFYLATASSGVANGIASIYSANLIRCTLTGATTDVAIVCAQVINGNTTTLARGSILSLIIFWFWVGSLLSYVAVENINTHTALFPSAVLFFCVGIILVYYLVKEVGVSFYDAVFGIWKWKNVLHKLNNEDGELTAERLIEIYDEIYARMDAAGDGDSQISCEELRVGMMLAKVQMSDYEINTLFRAADENGDGYIDKKEWDALVKKIL